MLNLVVSKETAKLEMVKTNFTNYNFCLLLCMGVKLGRSH